VVLLHQKSKIEPRRPAADTNDFHGRSLHASLHTIFILSLKYIVAGSCQPQTLKPARNFGNSETVRRAKIERCLKIQVIRLTISGFIRIPKRSKQWILLDDQRS
jgi:hypothetical protein